MRPLTATTRALCLTCVLVGLLATIGAAPVRADVSKALEAAPSNAHMVFVIPNLTQLNDKVSGLNRALGLNVAEMDNFLVKMKAEAKAVNGVDDNGSMVIILPDVASAMMGGGGAEPPMLMLIPVTDYDAFIGNYQPVTEDGNPIATLTMTQGQPAFAKKAGSHAVLSPLRAVTEAYEPGGAAGAKAIMTSLGKVGGAAATTAEVVMYFNLAAMSPTLSPMIDQGVAQANQELDQMAQFGMDPAMIKSQKDMLAMYASIGKMVLRDAAAGVATATMTDKGNGITYAIQFKDGTQLARMFPGGSNGPGKMLADLPDRAYIFAGAMDAKAINLGLISEELVKLIPEGDQQMAMLRESLPMIKQLKGAAGAFYAPQRGGAMGILNVLQVAYVDDTAAYLTATKKQMDQMNGMAVPMGAGGEMKFATTYAENAMEIGGTQVDQYNVTMQFPPEIQQQMMPLMMVLGGSGYGGYIAAKGDAVVTTMVTDPQLITAGLEAIGGGAGLGADPKLAELRKEALPGALAAEGYFSFAGVGVLANQYLPMFGMPPINIPADLPPIAFGAVVEGGGASVRYYVPNATVKFLIDEGRKFTGGAGGPAPF